MARLTQFVALSLGLQGVYAVSQSYCSSMNTGSSFDVVSNSYQTLGLCHNTCSTDGYSWAIVQDKDCWCSNSEPSPIVSISECNDECPGYPTESCGSKSADLYGYVAVNGTASSTYVWLGSETQTATSAGSYATGVSSGNATAASVAAAPTGNSTSSHGYSNSTSSSNSTGYATRSKTASSASKTLTTISSSSSSSESASASASGSSTSDAVRGSTFGMATSALVMCIAAALVL